MCLSAIKVLELYQNPGSFNEEKKAILEKTVERVIHVDLESIVAGDWELTKDEQMVAIF
jgi:hypothetical protein